MYQTCLFCNSDLGRNEVIEAFPVGRRLAFDGAKGRLWVVCRKCERWNLTPLEERWEAIESCEQQFRATKLRVSTAEIGLARVREGLELVRIGAPQRPEMAAWRYGDQFGRRRRRYYTMVAGSVAVAGTVIVAGPMLGLITAGAFSPALNLLSAANTIHAQRKLVHVPGSGGEMLYTRVADLPRVALVTDGDGIVLELPLARRSRAGRWWKYDGQREMRSLTGDDAIRAAGALLPRMNRRGGTGKQVQSAVSLLEGAGSPEQLYRLAGEGIEKRDDRLVVIRRNQGGLLKNIPTVRRLALEMAAHEETERRALEGELYILEAAWRDAEQIAGISDDMLLPASVGDDLERLKRVDGDRTP